MDTKYILLWLESPLQAWGVESKFNRRDTLEFPTKSGILGLVCSALGAGGLQLELLAEFADLKQIVISFNHTKNGKPVEKVPLLHDFQMIGSGYEETDIWQKLLIPKKVDGSAAVGGGTKLTHRYYLQNAVFAVILEVPAERAEQIACAIQNPVYDIYLGRKCCVPSDFVYQGIYETEKDAKEYALKKAELHTPDTLVPEFIVVDGTCEDGESFSLNDVPIQFGDTKKYKDRMVTKIMVENV